MLGIEERLSVFPRARSGRSVIDWQLRDVQAQRLSSRQFALEFNQAPTDPRLVTGGWDTLRGSVPCNLNGNTLTFSTPLSLIRGHSSDGNFAYRLETYASGGDPFHVVESHSAVAAAPGRAVLTVAGMIVLVRWYKGARRRLLHDPAVMTNRE